MAQALLPEWSHSTLEVTPRDSRMFLRQFDNYTVSLTLTDLPPHSSVRVSFDLFIISSWDGNSTEAGPDIWDLSVEAGPTLLHTTFQHQTEDSERRQAYPDNYPGGNHPPQTGADEINTLGSTFFGDSVYQLSFTFPHAASSLVLNFSGIGLEGIGD